MRESIHRYFKIGTISWMSFPNLTAIEAAKRIAQDDYFDAIEITQCNSPEERETFNPVPSKGVLWGTTKASWAGVKSKCP